MAARWTGQLPARLGGLQRRFARWRRTHKACARIPDSLWAAAVKMVGPLGLHRTAQALRLNYYALKRRAEPQVPTVSDSLEKSSVATFVELGSLANHSFAAMPAGPCECAVEWEDAAGRKMRIQFKSVPLPDLVALSRSFWNPSS